ncbi:GtrA family protein [Clostridium sporogenes]|uniref:GtrA family protein n=1 Tax=Clostridium sp. LCP25S3_F10 TaxID=3438750 RepID=UPI0013D05A1F|nr:GtrA family protein [Clostridium sporogenes]NFS27319.1 GtrA family protein [Clostridium sporogenes]
MIKNNGFIEFIKYVSIGALNVIIDFSVLNLLWFFTGLYSGNINYLFKLISFSIYSINGYTLNKKFTFKTKNSSYIQYASVIGIAAILNGIILSNLSSYNFLNVSQVIWSNISALIASMSTGILSFLINKFFIFKKN